MKKPSGITLALVAAAAMAACSRRGPDPCQPATFSEQACQDAIHNGGYYWHGTWFPLVYHNPYPYYYDSYNRYVSGGGSVVAAPTGSYSRPAGAVERGGFGATGAGHASGVGE